MTTTVVRHPVFARVYERMAPAFEAKGNAEHRDELLSALTGRVIEVGAGTGLNFAHYPPTVTEVLAVEPEPYLRAKAEQAAVSATVPVSVVDGVADQLPAPDASCDAGVSSLVLCSVPDQAAALAELWRVIRTGGELRFYEHVLSDDARLARAQRALDVVWPHVAGGCHANRGTVDAIAGAGFTIEHVRRFTFRPSIAASLTAPHAIGIARREAR